jgi:O-antigen ligase
MARAGVQAWRSQALAYLVAVLIFAGHLAFGANATALAIGFAGLWFALLAGMTTQGWARAAIGEQPLGLVGIAFALVLIFGVLSLTPFAIGGAHPVWSWVPGAVATGSMDPFATWLELLKLAALGAAFLVGVQLGADDERFRRVIRAILTVGLIYCAWALVDHVSNPVTLFGAPRESDPARLAASFGSPNTAATLFGLLTLLNLVEVARTYEARRSSGAFHVSHIQRLAPHLARPLVALALSASCLVLTLSRAGLASTTAVAIVLIGLMMLGRAGNSRISRAMLATGAIVGGFLIAILALNADAIQQRFLGFGADSLQRGDIFAAHWAAFTTAPWGGYGLGAFLHVNVMIMNAANLAYLDMLGATHNVYLQWLEEAGIPGAAAMFALVLIIAVQLVVAAVRRRRMRWWLVAILAILALFALHGGADYALQAPSMALFLSLLLGLGAGLSPGRAAADEPARAPAEHEGRYRTSRAATARAV